MFSESKFSILIWKCSMHCKREVTVLYTKPICNALYLLFLTYNFSELKNLINIVKHKIFVKISFLTITMQ